MTESKVITLLKERGFIEWSNTLAWQLHSHPELRFKYKRFKPGVATDGAKGAIKYSSIDLFGTSIKNAYYYDPENPEPLVNYLVKLFLAKNPNPSSGLRKVFTYLLHGHGLHWYGESRKWKS